MPRRAKLGQLRLQVRRLDFRGGRLGDRPRHSSSTRRWIGASSKPYVETQLAPTLKPGDIVISDNLAAHKSPAAEKAIRAKSAWLLFLLAKLKALLRARAIRTIDALWRATGEICDLFSPQECQNYFAAARYGFT